MSVPKLKKNEIDNFFEKSTYNDNNTDDDGVSAFLVISKLICHSFQSI